MSSEFEEYVKWHYDQLLPYSVNVSKTYTKKKIVGSSGGLILERKQIRKQHNGFRFKTHNHPLFSGLRKKWYVDGTKVIPQDIELSPLSIAIWYCDDGSNNYDDRRAAIYTQGFTLDEANFLISKLQIFGIKPSIVEKISPYDNRRQPILLFTGNNYDALIDLVKPFVIFDCFKYKVEWRNAIPCAERKKFHLSNDDVVNIKQMRKDGFTWRAISDKMNIRSQTIKNIIKRKENELH